MIPDQKGLQVLLIVREADVQSTLVELYANHAGRCADAVLEVARHAGRVVLAAVYLGDDDPDGEEADGLIAYGIPDLPRVTVDDLAAYSGECGNPLVRKYDDPFPLNGSVPTWCGRLNDLQASPGDIEDMRAALAERAAWRDSHAGSVLLAGVALCNDCGFPVQWQEGPPSLYLESIGFYTLCTPGHCRRPIKPNERGPGPRDGGAQ